LENKHAAEQVMFDEDVRAEADRVLLGEKDNEIVVIKNLRKVYGKSGRTSSLKHAVRDMNIAIPKGASNFVLFKKASV